MSQSQFKALKGKKENNRQTQGVVYFDQRLDAANSKNSTVDVEARFVSSSVQSNKKAKKKIIGKYKSVVNTLNYQLLAVVLLGD